MTPEKCRHQCQFKNRVRKEWSSHPQCLAGFLFMAYKRQTGAETGCVLSSEVTRKPGLRKLFTVFPWFGRGSRWLAALCFHRLSASTLHLAQRTPVHSDCFELTAPVYLLLFWEKTLNILRERGVEKEILWLETRKIRRNLLSQATYSAKQKIGQKVYFYYPSSVSLRPAHHSLTHAQQAFKCFWGRVSYPGCPETCYVSLTGFEFIIFLPQTLKCLD